MEKEGALTIWKRSIEKHKLRYTTMISDGDSATFPALSRAEPYGKNHLISKQESVGHVQKRMMSHLKAVKLKPHFSPDGKRVRMGGKGRLTDKLMKLFQRYFGKAIRSHPNDARRMKRAVMAIYFYSVSTDTHPQHHICSTEPTSWCKHNTALANGEAPPPHKPTICEEIAPFLKKVFEDLSTDELMERCILGATQNQNKSFNSLIWNRCPKVEFSSVDVVETCVSLAVITFNSGMGSLRPLFGRLGMGCGPTTATFLDSKDDGRIWRAEYVDQEMVRKRQQAMRLDRVQLWSRTILIWTILIWTIFKIFINPALFRAFFFQPGSFHSHHLPKDFT